MFDFKDNTPLIEKIMAHFGWYKVKMVEFPISEVNIQLVNNVIADTKDIENAINQIKQEGSGQQKYQTRNRARKTSTSSSSNSPKRTTRSQKKESE